MAPADVGAQLERILSSRHFASSPRLTAFLRYVVTRSQSSETESLKEYAIGVEVFRRGAEFDPRLDNIVRIQAARLRSRLVEYYAAEGDADPIIISIPKGGYAPETMTRSAPPTIAAPVTDRSRVAVLPFVNMSSNPENEYLSDGLTEEIINRLAGLPGLHVVARTSVFSFKGRNEDLRIVGRKLNVGVILEGSIRAAGTRLRVTAQLVDVESGFRLFSRSYDRELSDVLELQDEVAEAVAGEIAPATERRSAAVSEPSISMHTRRTCAACLRCQPSSPIWTPALRVFAKRSVWTPVMPRPGRVCPTAIFCWRGSTGRPSKL